MASPLKSRVRCGGFAAALAVGAVLLTACQKPLPDVYALGGSRYVTIGPSSYCFDATHCRRGTLDLPEFTVGPDDKVMIEVPEQVADRGWAVSALALKNLKLLGSSGAITHQQSYRVAANVASGAPFIVRIDELAHGRPDGGTWSLLVRVSQTAT